MATIFDPTTGAGLAASRYDFQSHILGEAFNHTAPGILLSPNLTIGVTLCTQVQQALTALTGGSSNFQAGGDLSGSNVDQTVVGFNGVPINTSISPSTNDVWMFTSGQWTIVPPSSVPFSLSGSAGGDLSGSYPNPTVAKINTSSVPAGGALTTGNVLQVSGIASLTYAPLNLAGGANYITGTLPSGNQAAQTMGGDVSGTTASSTVVAIQTYAVSNTAPTNGQVLQYSTGSSKYVPTTLSLGTLSGDVTGSAGSNTVVSLTGSGGAVSVKANLIPNTNNTLTLGNSLDSWERLYLGSSIRWPSTFIPTQTGDIGMDLTGSSGRPHAYIDGYDHGLSAWRGYFGDASDGYCTANGTNTVPGMSRNGSVYTLTRDCHFEELVVGDSADILLDGFRLFVNGVLFIATSSLIGAPGNNAPNNTGVAGAAISTGTVLGSSVGGTGGISTGGAGGSLSNALGGSGGTGGAGTNAAGSGGTATVPSGISGSLRHIPEAVLAAVYSATGGSWVSINGGCGGGAGGGASGTTGGGGGSGGGVSVIAARVLVGSGSLSVQGGNGGSSSGSGDGGGGAGGGGGLLILIAGDVSNFTGSIVVSGGTGGAGTGGGATGGSGSSGTYIYLPA